jgi:F-type H+-transporting ATPase subunit epsilon
MRLNVILPASVMPAIEVVDIHVKTTEGWWTFLPRHADMVTVIVPHVMTCKRTDGGTVLFALDDGLLVKNGPVVTVAVRHASSGKDSAELETTVKDDFVRADEQEQKMRLIISRLQADFSRFFTGLDRRP